MTIQSSFWILLFLSAGHASATVNFSAQDIGDLAGGTNYSRAYGMNARGEIVGESSMSYTPSAESAALLSGDFGWSGVRGFIWSQGTISEVGRITHLTGKSNQFTIDAFNGVPLPSVNTTWALDIRGGGSARAIDNNGNIYIESGQRGSFEYSLYPIGTVTSQDTFAGSASMVSRSVESLYGVNAVSGNGTVAGFTATGAATWRSQTGIRSLPEGSSSGSGGIFVFGVPSTMANGINNAGIAVGESKGLPVWWDAQGQVHDLDVFRPVPPIGGIDPCAGLPDCHALIITNPGLNWHSGSATGINNHDAIVGISSDGGFLWQNGQLTRLLDGSRIFNPLAINDQGQIVGSFSDGHAGIRLSDGTYLDINSTVSNLQGWTFTEAVAINEAGQIAVNGMRDGITHAFLLSPVPEPGALWMFLAGLPLLAARRARFY